MNEEKTMRFVTRFRTSRAALAAVAALALALAVALPAGAQGTPVTLPALKAMPGQTALALGVPPVTVLEGKLVPMLNRIAPELEIEQSVQDMVDDFAEDFGIEGAKTLRDIGVGIGVDFDAPMAVFVDVSPSLESLETMMKEMEEAEEDAALSPEDIVAGYMEVPAFSAVMTISDQAKAEAAISEFGKLSPDFDPEGYEKIAAGEVMVRSWGSDVFNYVLTEKALVMGNSLDMVAATAMRLDDPATLRYGSDPSVPMVSNEDIVALLFGGDFMPAAMGLLVMMMEQEDPTVAALYKSQLEMMAAMWEGEGAEDPLVISMGIDDDKLEVLAGLDTKLHPAALEQSGAPVALQLAPLLNEDTLMFLSLVLTPEMKKTISDTYLKAAAAQSPENPQMAQAMTIGKQVLQMVGPELAIGISPVQDDLPALTAMIQLTEPDATKGLLQLFVPTQAGETYNEVDLLDIVAPVPVQLSMAYLDDVVLVSNNLDEMKRIIDLRKAGEQSALFAGLNPPLDPATPRWSALMLNTSLYTDIIMPLAMLFGAVPEEADMVASRLAENVREMRSVAEMRGEWYVSSLGIMLHEEKAAEGNDN
jgi:hypothetical protein